MTQVDPSTEMTLFFDSVSIRRAAKVKGLHTDYTGLMHGLKMLYNIVEARLYIIKNTDSSDASKFDAYVAQVTKAGFKPIIQEVSKDDGFFYFTPRICIDALGVNTKQIGIGTTDISILPLLQTLKEREHTITLFSIEKAAILMPCVDNFYSAAK